MTTNPPQDDHEPETDRMWDDRFQHVIVDIELPPQFTVLLKPDAELIIDGRWYYQIECQRPDTFTGVMGTGRGGKAYLSPHMAENELVQTVWGLYQSYVMHEARESFQWRGRRVFGPHISTQALWDIADRTEYRS